MQQAHAEPNYIAVFIWLAALTALEVIVVYLPLTKFALAAIPWSGLYQGSARGPLFYASEIRASHHAHWSR